MRYFPQHVLLCTSTVHDQSANVCFQGNLRILWIENTKFSKLDTIHKCYALCLKLEYFFKSCKTNPWMQQVAVRCQSKNITWNRSMACRDTLGLLSLSRWSVWAVCVVCGLYQAYITQPILWGLEKPEQPIRGAGKLKNLRTI